VLGLRILTGVVAVPALVGVAVVGGYPALIAVLVGAVVGAAELFLLLQAAGYRPLTPLGIILAAGLVFDAAYPSHGILSAALAIATVLAAAWLMRRPDWSGSLVDWAVTFLPALYVGGLIRFFLPLRALGDGLFWTLVVLAGTWACDIAAYFVGRAMGRTKLAPRISPGKSVEGAVAGVACAVAVGVVGALYHGQSVPRVAMLGLIVGVCTVGGDLIESFVKRQLGAKDSGILVPGHGGLLDRIDGLIVAVAGAYLYVVATGS
jgi:phosphatidate cytidylyltransferase